MGFGRKKRKQWWLEPGSEEHRCIRVILGEGQPGGRRCRYKAHEGGVCKVHLRYDPLPPMPAIPAPAPPAPASMPAIDEERPRARVKPEALLERQLHHDAGMTTTTDMMRQAATVLARVAGEFERTNNAKPPHERTATEALQAAMAERELRAVLFVRRRELQSAIERCLDYCMPGTIRIAEHDLRGVMFEKAALAENLSATQALATKLSLEGRRYRDELARMVNAMRAGSGLPALSDDVMDRQLERIRIGERDLLDPEYDGEGSK